MVVFKISANKTACPNSCAVEFIQAVLSISWLPLHRKKAPVHVMRRVVATFSK